MNVDFSRIVVQEARGMSAFHSLRQNQAFCNSTFKKVSSRTGQGLSRFATQVKNFLLIICGGDSSDLIKLIDTMLTMEEKVQLKPCSNVCFFHNNVVFEQVL